MRAIEKIKRLLISHRKTHICWRDYLKKHPEKETEHIESAGGIQHHIIAIRDYDEALEALAILEKEPDLKKLKQLLENGIILSGDELEALKSMASVDFMVKAYTGSLTPKDVAESINGIIESSKNKIQQALNTGGGQTSDGASSEKSAQGGMSPPNLKGK